MKNWTHFMLKPILIFLENKTWLPGKSDDSLVYGQIFKYWNVPNRSYVLALFVVICHEIDMFFRHQSLYSVWAKVY